MDLYRIIGELVTERNRLQRIIDSLEQVETSETRPARVARPARGRKPMDQKARQEVSRRMKIYWAKRRGGEDGAPPAA